MIALTFSRSVPRYVASRVLGRAAPGLVGNAAALRLGHTDDLERPTPEWVRVAPKLAGICGSDLAMISGVASFYFDPIATMPFVPGHEVVGELLDDTPDLAAGTRVVVEPVLGCLARGVDPPCEACAAGDKGLCRELTSGHISPGLQTGFCEDVGGGWGTELLAHPSQLHAVPEAMSDEQAVLVEPLACAVHAVLRAQVSEDDLVVVSGAGTMGLLTIAALARLAPPTRIVAVAKHPHQREQALRLGASEVTRPDVADRSIRLATGSVLHTPERGRSWLSGGADVCFECSGSASGLDVALRTTRPRGRVVLVGLPGPVRIDLAPVWHRELEVMGAYTYGIEEVGGKRRPTFEVAIELAAELDLAPLLSAAYPLTRYTEALDHAMDAGRLGATKIAFDLGGRRGRR